MNKSYKSIYNESLSAWVAASEVTSSGGKRSGKAAKASALATTLSLTLLISGQSVAGEFASPSANASGPLSVAIGINAIATNTASLALGAYTNNTSLQGTSIGYGSVVSGVRSQAIGYEASANGSDNLAIGTGASVDTGYGGIAIGTGASVVGDTGAAIGRSSKAAQQGFAAGNAANAAELSVAVGAGASTQSAGTAIGYVSSAASSAFAGGTGSHANGASSIAINTTVGGDYAIGLGSSAISSNTNAVAVGRSSTASAVGSTALGASAASFGQNAVALGAATARGPNAIAIGAGSNVNTEGSIVIGNTASSFVAVPSAYYTGQMSGANGLAAVAIGGASGSNATGANATGDGALAFGGAIKQVGADLSAGTVTGALASGVGAVAIGSGNNGTSNSNTRGAQATGRAAVAIGAGIGNSSVGAIASGDRAIAIGGNDQHFAIGSNAAAAGAIAIGFNSDVRVAATDGISIGANSRTSQQNAIAMGVGAVAAGGSSTSVGAKSGAYGNGSTVVGVDAFDGGTEESTVLGAAASVQEGTDGKNVALGAAAVSQRGSRTGFTGYGRTATESSVGEVSIGDGADTRQITNLAAGTAATDAVNVSQLNDVGANLASALGGGAALDPTTGAFTQPSYTVGGVVRNDVGSALAATNALSAQYTPDAAGAPTAAIDLTKGGTIGATKLSGLAPGAITAASTDAVTGSQVYGSNAGLATALGGGASVNPATGALTAPAYTVGGVARNDVGSALAATNALSVQYTPNSAGAPTAMVDLTKGNTLAPTTISGVAPGAVAAGSTQAVNGAQLFATEASIAGLTNGSAGLVRQFNNTSAITVGEQSLGTSVSFANSASAPRKLIGVAAGSLNPTSTEAVNGTQLYATDMKVAGLTTAVDTGTVGPLQYSSAAAPTVPSGGVKSNDVTLVGAIAGPVGLHNVKSGTTTAGSTDAINGGQFNSGLASVAAGIGGGAAYDPATGKVSAPTYTVNGVTYNNAGDAFGGVNNAISGGTGIKYFHTNSILADSVANGLDATAAGANAKAVGAGSVALGRNTVADSDSSVAIGDDALATGGKAVSIGAGNLANGNGAVAIGDPNFSSSTGAVAVGADNLAVGDGSVALGNLNGANGTAAIALGNASEADGASTVALGDAAKATGANALAFGGKSIANGIDAIAIGANSNAGSINSIAIGAGSNVSVTNSVAIGTASAALRGIQSSYSAYGLGAGQASAGEVSFGSAGSARQLTNVAPGSQPTDAANVGQLSTSVNRLATGVAGVLGGGVNLSNGAYTGNTYNTAEGSTSNTLQGGFDTYNAAIDRLNNGGSGPVQYSNAATPTMRNGGVKTNDVTLVGAAAGTVGLHNLRNGSTVLGSTDAINGGQLNAGLASVATGLGGGAVYDPATGKVTAPSYTIGGQNYNSAGAALNAVNNSISNGVGIKYFHTKSAGADSQAQGAESVAIGAAAAAKYANSVALGSGSETGLSAPTGTGFITGASAPASEVSVGTSAAQRRITNVAAGSAATDAVNVSQLSGMAGNINSVIGQTVFDPLTGAAVAPSFTVGGKSYDNLTSTVSAIDSGLASSGAASAALVGAINNGTIGLVQQAGGAPGSGVITVGAGTGGTRLDVSGTEGNRVLTGIAAGVNGNDAATVAQVAAAGNAAANTWITAKPVIYAAPSATGTGGMAIGSGANSTGVQSVALGENASDGGRDNVVSIGATGAERQLTNVAAGTVDTDAANLQQVRAVTAILGGGAQIRPDGSVQWPTYSVSNVKSDGTFSTSSYTNVGDAIGGLNGSIASLTTAVRTVTNGGGTYVQLNTTGPAAQATGTDSLAAGPGAKASGESSIAIGSGSSATGKGDIAVGLNSSASGSDSTAVGSNSKAANGGSAFGSHSDASQSQQGTALGTHTTVKTDGGVALGAGSTADRAGMAGANEAFSGIAVGSTQGAVSVGTVGGERQIINVAGGTQATDAVNVRQLEAVQSGSVQYERNSDGTVNYGKLVLGNGQAPDGTVVSNVAPGVAGTDAANVNQLNSAQTATNSRIDSVNNRIEGVARNAYAGVATAMAVQMPGTTAPGKVAMRLGSAVFKGESAVGLSFRRTSSDAAFTLTGGVGMSRAGAAASVGAEWVFD